MGLRSGVTPLAVLLALLVVPLFASGALARIPECEGSHAPHGREHPASCRFFATDGQSISWRQLAENLENASLVLLGEVHDNADHHRIRAALIVDLGGIGNGVFRSEPFKLRPPALVFEHIRVSQQPALDKYRVMIEAARPADDIEAAVTGLLLWLEWEQSGWPAADLFRPLFVAARSGRYAILAGDPPRANVRRVAREGLAALDASDRQRLGLDAPLPPSQHDALLTELEGSHCGLMPKSAFGTMAVAQRYRDAHLAAAVADAAEKHDRAILLAGNGHVRSDRGVPYYLRQIAPGKKTISVLFLEVEDGKTDPATYVERDPDGKPIADYFVLTPRAERPDPCVEMKKRFAKPPQ